MKKWLLFFVVILLSVTKVFADNNPEIHKLSVQSTVAIELKDPQLIKITHTEPIDKTLYDQKTANEKKQYSDNKKQIDDDYYNLYRILERLVRANNLYYQNWRIMLKSETENVNAESSAANLVTIYSSLYDSLYDNESALAFILAHELGHFLLGHHQTTMENIYQIRELERSLGIANQNIADQNTMANFNRALGNNYGVLTNQLSNTAYMASIVIMTKNINKLYEELRTMEFDADSEAITLLARAGYNLDESTEAMEFIAKLPNIYTSKSTHPPTTERIKNINEVIEISDVDELKNEGERNIYNSSVLNVRKSSDKKSVVMSKLTNNNKVSYQPKTKKDKMLELAYKSYLNRDMKTSEKYFTKVFDKYPSDYIAPLYLSYIYEYNFYIDNDKKNLKTAAHWCKTANKIKPDNKNVLKQKSDIIADFKKLKADNKPANP